MFRWKLSIALLLAVTPLSTLWLPAPGFSQSPDAPSTPEPSGVYIIFDGSGSMWGQLPDGTHKVTAAREVLTEFVGRDFGDRELALRAYGHRRKADCSDSELVVDFADAQSAIDPIREFARSINPKGKTPIGRSLRAALDDMGERAGQIILISDGIETCDDDPCALVKAWREKDISIQVHVVGLGLDEKEKTAMQCIADAAGTEFRDAQSADELAAGLETIRQAAGPSPASAETKWQVLDVNATNAAGERMRVVGVAERDGFDPIGVTSNGHNRIPPGTWQVTVGIKTRNGNTYRPVTQTVEVGTDGATESYFEVLEPPSVKAKFLELGKLHRGASVSAFQDGEEVLRFRAKDRAYVDPGTYEFRSQPNSDNKLSVIESFEDGDHKEIVFELVQTVKVKIKMFAAGTDTRLRSNLELWQDGERRYKVHSNNGARVLPGTYDVRLPLYLTPYVHDDLVVTTEAEQDVRIEVPMGHLVVRYQHADGSPIGDPNAGERVFLERVTTATYKSDGIKRANEPIPLTAGKYKLEGWSNLGSFEPVMFEIRAGETKEIVLRSKS